MSVQNLNAFGQYRSFYPSSSPHSSLDPFADAADPLAADEPGRQSYIHIRIQQRNGRKTLTTLQGLPKGERDFDFHRCCDTHSRSQSMTQRRS